MHIVQSPSESCYCFSLVVIESTLLGTCRQPALLGMFPLVFVNINAFVVREYSLIFVHVYDLIQVSYYSFFGEKFITEASCWNRCTV